MGRRSGLSSFFQKSFNDTSRPRAAANVICLQSDPTIVYVGTGNQSGWSFTSGKGVYKSIDGGRTWTNSGLRGSQYIGGIFVDPRNANNVLVAAQGARAGAPGAVAGAAGRGAEAGERGVYRSSDGGRAWTRVLPSDGSSGASDIQSR